MYEPFPGGAPSFCCANAGEVTTINEVITASANNPNQSANQDIAFWWTGFRAPQAAFHLTPVNLAPGGSLCPR
jgi:hypothetical protein